MIRLNNISYQYPNSDFQLVIETMQIEKGKKTAIIGPSGFGKTTMLNLIAGILLPQTGNIYIGDRTINRFSDKERREYRIKEIGFVFQDFKLLSYLTVFDNILLPLRINHAMQMDSDSKTKAIEVASALDIRNKLYKYPSKLSHGERQRVAIGRALLNKPPILLADEPTGNLDPDNKTHILEILYKYVTDYEATLITVTHDHELLKGFDKIIDFKDLHTAE
jgi:putative ABC transport system ATP-binding protein